MKRLLSLLLTPSLAFAHDLPIWAVPLIPLTLPISTLQKSKLNSAMTSVKLALLEKKLLLTSQGKPYALAMNYRLKLGKTFPAEHSVTPKCQVSHPQLNCDETHFSTINGQKLDSFNAEPRPAGDYTVRFLIYPRGLNLNPQEQPECRFQEDLSAARSSEPTETQLSITQPSPQKPSSTELIFHYRLSNKPWSHQVLEQKISDAINPTEWLNNTKPLTLKYCKKII